MTSNDSGITKNLVTIVIIYMYTTKSPHILPSPSGRKHATISADHQNIWMAVVSFYHAAWKAVRTYKIPDNSTVSAADQVLQSLHTYTGTDIELRTSTGLFILLLIAVLAFTAATPRPCLSDSFPPSTQTPCLMLYLSFSSFFTTLRDPWGENLLGRRPPTHISPMNGE